MHVHYIIIHLHVSTQHGNFLCKRCNNIITINCFCNDCNKCDGDMDENCQEKEIVNGFPSRVNTTKFSNLISDSYVNARGIKSFIYKTKYR